MRNKIDPIAQAMQLLQLVTQRRNQQAGMEQGNRELDLRAQQLAQQEALAREGMNLDRERFTSQNELGQQELAQRGSQFEKNYSLQEQQVPTDIEYKKMLIKHAQERLLGKEDDPRMMALQAEEMDQAMAYLQNKIDFAPNGIEAQRYREQLAQLAQQRFGKFLPPLRPYTEQEQRDMNTFKPQTK